MILNWRNSCTSSLTFWISFIHLVSTDLYGQSLSMNKNSDNEQNNIHNTSYNDRFNSNRTHIL